MPLELIPIPAAGGTDGYYAKRAKVLLAAGQVNFNADFNLEPTVLVADEPTVTEILLQTDDWIDGEAWRLGLTMAGTGTHYVATGDNPLYANLCNEAARMARAAGHLLRGDVGEPAPEGEAAGPLRGGPEGVYAKTKRNAMSRITELLSAKVAQAAGQGDVGGFGSVALRYDPECVCDEFSDECN